ncbi:MAG TPA: ADOP family duplicated permease, partial [Candidatus Acidoferrales bacterium]|nr:ADOP family duplicated permease [Candidatus Acidoferrales bacterium]HEV3483194.1 ADOP family duplicated permease [Candidatus Acidoferrales bacterium]
RVRAGHFLETLWQDIRFGARMLRTSPGFTIVAVLTLALGIGANTAIFSATYSILLKPLPYKDSERLVNIGAVPPGEVVEAGSGDSLYSFAIEEIKSQTKVFEQVIALELGIYRFKARSGPTLLLTGLVSGNYFTTLGVKPALGRMISPSDAPSGSGRVVVLSYMFWQKQFAGDSKIVGRQLELADVLNRSHAPAPYTVIGVAPASFASPIFSSYGRDCDAWIPQSPRGINAPGNLGGDIVAIARLKRGVTLEKANAALQSLSEVLGEEYPQTARGWNLHAEGLKDVIVGIGKPRLALMVLLGAVGLLLLIACVNVSSLMLARAWGRSREIAIREALGATRLRVVRQSLTETLLLFLLGCGLGLLLAHWGISALRANAPQDTPRLGEIGLYGAVLWYALGISIVTAIVFGLAPALQVSGRKLYTRLNATGMSSVYAGGERRHVYRHGPVILEVSLAVVLLVGSGLLLRSFAKLLSVPLGLRTDHILTTDVQLDQGTCNGGALCNAAFDQIVERIQALPGVEEVAITNYPPLEGGGIFTGVSLEPPSAATASQPGPTAKSMQVGPAYFRLMGIPLLRGREFTAADSQHGSPPVVIVNQAFAKKFFGGHVVGRRLWLGLDKKKKNRWMYIVGEVRDARDSSPSQAPQPEEYTPFDAAFPSGELLVRTQVSPESLVPAIREQIEKVSTAPFSTS